MTNEVNAGAATGPEAAAWKAIVLKYQTPSTWRALWQIVDTLVPIAALWYLMYLCLPVSWWLVAPLAMLLGALLVRVFIIFHDCGHGSFFKSPAANDMVGFLAGILTFTPYYQWRWEHAIHHSAAGDLDRRGTGDVWTLTVQEYLESSRWKNSPTGWRGIRSCCSCWHRCICSPSGSGFRPPNPIRASAIPFMR